MTNAARSTTRDPLNAHVANVLDETARLLEEQRANPFRVQAYRNAADTVRGLRRGVDEILDAEGLAGLDRLPGIGQALARVIDQVVTTGRFPMLERLHGASSGVAQLASIPGIGATLAQRLRDEHGIGTLEQLEIAAHDGTLAAIAGFGEKRIAGIQDVLATRLGRRSRREALNRAAAERHAEPSVEEILDIDREYRDGAVAGTLPRIAPRRFNPTHAKWLAILHGLNTEFWHQTVTTQQIESYISTKSGIDLGKVFDQYLRTTDIPLLKYNVNGKTVSFNYERVVKGFAMPLRVTINGQERVITPTESKQTLDFPEEIKNFDVNRNFYIETAKGDS